MGKPFSQELKKINQTYTWASEVQIENLEQITDVLFKKPLFVVGSGGSSSACSLFALLHQKMGIIASAITPLELQYSKNAINKNCNIVFISASGKNSDILFAFDTAVKKEPNNILSICLKKDSPLNKKSLKYSIANIIDFENPAGKDGFLATNSLVAYFTIISRIYKLNYPIKDLLPSVEFLSGVRNFSKLLYEDFTITVLYAGWGKPVAIDIESKFSEAGLGNILLSDYRNFGHGRHNWFDKKRKQSAIVALITKEDEELANKTLDLLPLGIPVLKIDTNYEYANASIDLLVKSFYLVDEIGKMKNIDPGRPGVPDYGRKLYHLKYSKFYSEKNKISDKVKNAIIRKFGNIESFSKENILPLWMNAYNDFIENLNNKKFKGILLDYDGTICSTEERFDAPRKEIIEKLEYFLSKGITIGIITGRGKSVRENFQKLISEKYWDKFVIGYYNGAQIGTLNNINLPVQDNSNVLFFEIEKLLISEPLIQKFTKIDLREGQLTIHINDKHNSEIIKEIMIDILKRHYPFNIQILESSHSIDIILIETSKNLIINHFENLLNNENMKDEFLCIGDRGKWPGNDFHLLSNKFSLSVDETSNDPHTCWNLSSVGINCVETTLEYFEAITPFENGYFKIKL
jgi:hydroxymethylpyrimidine pyrophosphatase-like HAD family hydrolase